MNVPEGLDRGQLDHSAPPGRNGPDPVRIMVLIPTKTLSGPVKGVLQLIDHTDPEEFDIRLYGFRSRRHDPGSLVNALRSRGIPVELLDQKSRSYRSLARQVVGEIRKNGYSVVQTHGFKPTVLGFIAKSRLGTKWICFQHGTTSENLKVRTFNRIDAVLQRWADRTVLVSETQRRKIPGGRAHERVRVLHNAIDPDDPAPLSPDPRTVRDRLGLAPDSRLAVAVGRFSPEKGMDLLVEAFSRLSREPGDLHLVLVGDGQERASLERQVDRLGLRASVHFPGHVETPGDFLAAADLFVLSSRSEGIPNAVLEAMAFGVPVVATSVGGIPEIIESGTDGLLVPPGRPDLLADAVATVLGDHELAKRLARHGKRRIEDAFGVQGRIAKIHGLYREVLGMDDGGMPKPRTGELA